MIFGNIIVSCPNDCSGHGTCLTLSNLISYYGSTYTAWDSDSISICNCDDGYFGADCSQGTIFFLPNIFSFSFLSPFNS